MIRIPRIAVLLTFSCCSLVAQSLQARSTARTGTENVGHAKDARLLVIQAEDLGMARSIDKASFEAIEKGWVTTAGVLVPGPWFPEVLRWARNHPDADLGVRLDVNSDWSSYRWRAVSSVHIGSGLVDSDGYLSNSQIYVAQHAAQSEVETEIRAQIDLAKKAGISLSHLDNHMRALTVTPAMFQSYWKMGQEFGLPVVLTRQQVRARGTPTQKPGIYNFGGVEVDMQKLLIDQELEIMPGFAQKDWLSAYENALKSLPPGVYLLSVHLGFNDEELQGMTWDHPNWGAQWRQNDYDVISSQEFHKFLKDQGFVLVNWKDLQRRMAEKH